MRRFVKGCIAGSRRRSGIDLRTGAPPTQQRDDWQHAALRGENVLDPNRQAAHALPRSMEDGIRNCGRHSEEDDFTEGQSAPLPRGRLSYAPSALKCWPAAAGHLHHRAGERSQGATKAPVIPKGRGGGHLDPGTAAAGPGED
jgi:hypothetical protein